MTSPLITLGHNNLGQAKALRY